MTKEKFLYYYITEFIHRDLELLVQYEKRLMEMEERISEGHAAHFLSDFSPVRKELLTLRSYYDELMDLGRELETNENGFFAKKQTKYFAVLSAAAIMALTAPTGLCQRRCIFSNTPDRFGTPIRVMSMPGRMPICSF